ncbi:MAG: hypothetical protein KC492_28925, partial [Myxococcales bacterium]|nr:hypothetical protein [Myxococcales bacterium]
MTDSTDRDSDPPSEDRDSDAGESVASASSGLASGERASEPDADTGGAAPVRRKKRRKKRRKADVDVPDTGEADDAQETEDTPEETQSSEHVEAATEGKPAKASGPGWFAEHYLKADPRWLGVFRIVLGVILSVDLLRRWANADAFYT